ncbi:50S ribosomal protein L10 [uncultured Porphyromonas sp.]|jgi:ribosomal protein L10|uniref:50S ribosomal protein L10 n=1 Tax=uncultured Porphyromonas sp. TaxID=159274 RepID=UPI0026196F39|nr:50S ribosomal protein L10 [uncultured Porphyromonas sp.]
MRKENKGVVVEQLKGFLSEYPHFYLTNIEGLDAAKTAQLRRACNKGGIKLVVAKNTLLRKALSEAEVDFATLYSALKGNTAVMFTTVANAPAKIIKDFAKDKKEESKLRLKAAYAETGFYGADQLAELVAIKSKEELIADVVALLQSPIRNVLSALENKDAEKEAAVADAPAE